MKVNIAGASRKEAIEAGEDKKKPLLPQSDNYLYICNIAKMHQKDIVIFIYSRSVKDAL